MAASLLVMTVVGCSSETGFVFFGRLPPRNYRGSETWLPGYPRDW